jgi:N6-L-threonylcarbamoyladenine synthase
VAALGAHLLAAGAPPSQLDIPADPGLPITTSLVGSSSSTTNRG